MHNIYYWENVSAATTGVEAWHERWQMSKRDGKCVLIGGKNNGQVYRADVGEHERELNEKAAGVCPVDVIQVETQRTHST